MNPRLRKLSRILLRALAVLSAMLILAAVAAWGFRTRIATSVAQSYLQELGFQDPQLTITKLQTDSLIVESIELSHGGARFIAPRLTVSFSLAELLEFRRIKSVTLGGANITLPTESFSENTAPDEAEVLPTLDTLAQLIDLSEFQPLPFQRIQIVDSQLTIVHKSVSIPFSLSADAIASKSNSLKLYANFGHATHTLELNTTQSAPEGTQLAATLHIDDPIALLSQYVPTWSNQLPDLHALTSPSLDLHATLDQSPDEQTQLNATLRLHDLAIDYEEISADLSQFSVNTSLNDFSEIPLRVEIIPRRIARDTLAATPQQPIELNATFSNLNVVTFQTQNPIGWSYDSGYFTASSDILLRYELANTIRPLQATIENTHVVANEMELAPFAVVASGTTSQLTFQSGPLALKQSTPATLEAVTGSLAIPDAPDSPITFKLKGTLHPEAFAFNNREATLSPSQLKLETLVFDTRTETNITLTTQAEEALADFPGLAQLQGRLALTSLIKQEGDSDLISGWSKIDASNLSIRSDALTGNGIAIQSQVDFKNLDTIQLTELDPSDDASLANLLSKLSASFDWQANQLTTPTGTAQWSGGGLTLKTDEDQLVITSSIGAGILTFDQLRLDQLYVENEHRGTLAALSGETRATAMLDGIALQIDSTQTISSPLSNLSLNGEYRLAPATLTHSDLLSRFVSELAGLSVSAAIQANGTFEFRGETADASLAAQVREGVLSYPASQVKASGLEIDLALASLAKLASGESVSSIRIRDIEAGDLRSISADSKFRIKDGQSIAIDSASVSLFGGQAKLRPTEIPIDGSDFQSTLDLDSFDLGQIARYIEIFDGQMQGEVSGYLPFRLKGGRFELLRGDLRLPDGSPASLKYQTQGLLTEDSPPETKASFSERLLKFLKVDPDRTVEQALGDITITKFETELFPEDDPQTPIRIRLEGIAHSQLADIPVVIDTQVHGSLSELYNFLIRLNSL